MSEKRESFEAVSMTAGHSEGVLRTEKVPARTLGPDSIGRLIGCHANGVNYPAKILEVGRVSNPYGPPLVLLKLRHSEIPGRAAFDGTLEVAPDDEIELVDIVAM